MSDAHALWVFDLDGVLVDSSPCHARAYEDLWDRVGIEGPSYPLLAGRTTRDVVSELTNRLQPSDATLQEWIRFKQEQARRYIRTEARLFEDTRAALGQLEERGIVLALGTAASRRNAMLTLDHFGLTDHFRVIVTGDDVGRGKPEPDVYDRAIREAGFRGTEALVVEDSGAGLAAGLAAEAWVASVRSHCTVAHRRFVGAFPTIRALVEHIS